MNAECREITFCLVKEYNSRNSNLGSELAQRGNKFAIMWDLSG